MAKKNPRLAPFIGNDPLCEGELCGHTLYRKQSTECSFLTASDPKKVLGDYAMNVQQAINIGKENEEFNSLTEPALKTESRKK